MSALDDIRALIADKVQYDRSTGTGDGATVDFEMPNAPAVTGSVAVRKNGALQTVGADYAVDEAVGLVTFTTAPADGAAIVITYRHTILSDADLTAFLSLTGSDTMLAAALALDTIASSEALVQKVITVLGLSTNGAAVADSLRKHAATLRERAADAVAGFAIAEMVYPPFGWAERVWKEHQRRNA